MRNALAWLYDRREGRRLSGRLLCEMGGIGAILSAAADDALEALGPRKRDALGVFWALSRLEGPDEQRPASERRKKGDGRRGALRSDA